MNFFSWKAIFITQQIITILILSSLSYLKTSYEMEPIIPCSKKTFDLAQQIFIEYLLSTRCYAENFMAETVKVNKHGPFI